MTDHYPTANIIKVCVAVCHYLGKYDAHIEVLADHCECSVMTIRRAIKHLQTVGVPIHHIRDNDTGNGLPTEHYWRLDKKLTRAEVGAHVCFIFLPEEEAQDLLELAQHAGANP